MIALWNTIFYEPLYNALVFLITIVPWADVGIAVILLTIVVKLILFPLSQKSIKSQAKVKSLEPEIQKIKETYKDKQEQSKKTMELYKANKTNPFAGCLLILIQLPIIIALYWVFMKGLDFGVEKLYPFIHFPPKINMEFLGIINMQEKSLFLAILAGLSQFIHAKISSPKTKPTENKNKTFQGELMKSMNLQMKYVLPIFIAFIAYRISAAVALYWTVSNIFTIIQELIVRRRIDKDILNSQNNQNPIIYTKVVVSENKNLNTGDQNK